jgi:hypothetical protein
MVEVDFGALGRGQTGQVFVIGVVLEEGYAIRTDALEDGLGHGRLSGSRSASDANDKWAADVHICIIPPLPL